MNLKKIKIHFLYIQDLEDSSALIGLHSQCGLPLMSISLAHSENKGPMASGRLGIWSPAKCSHYFDGVQKNKLSMRRSRYNVADCNKFIINLINHGQVLDMIIQTKGVIHISVWVQSIAKRFSFSHVEATAGDDLRGMHVSCVWLG